MRFDRFDRTVWGILAVLVLALGGLVAASSLAGARVVRVFPPAGEAVGPYGPIGVEFGQPMQAGSLAPRFTIEPHVPGEWQVSGSRAVFVPGQPFEPGVTYSARLGAGVAGDNGRQTRRAIQWSFSVRSPWLAYIAPATGGPPELWRAPLNPADGDAQKLTDTGGKVFDYAASRDGEQIAYTVVNDQGGADLWLMARDGSGARPLVSCGTDRCTVPAWAPDGQRLAYSREAHGHAADEAHEAPRIWTVTAASGETAPLYQDPRVLGYGPSWSPDGSRLAFFDGGARGIRVLNLETTAEVVLPNAMGIAGAFSPDGARMFFTDVLIENDRVSSVLYLADLDSQEVTVPFTGEAQWSDYGTPAWSPDGDWLAVSLRVGDRSPAKQLWLVRPDGSDARPISQDLAYTHGAYRWDAWGRALAFQVVPLGTPFPEPEILLWSFETDTLTLVAKNASLPGWLH